MGELHDAGQIVMGKQEVNEGAEYLYLLADLQHDWSFLYFYMNNTSFYYWSHYKTKSKTRFLNWKRFCELTIETHTKNMLETLYIALKQKLLL